MIPSLFIKVRKLEPGSPQESRTKLRKSWWIFFFQRQADSLRLYMEAGAWMPWPSNPGGQWANSSFPDRSLSCDFSSTMYSTAFLPIVNDMWTSRWDVRIRVWQGQEGKRTLSFSHFPKASLKDPLEKRALSVVGVHGQRLLQSVAGSRHEPLCGLLGGGEVHRRKREVILW